MTHIGRYAIVRKLATGGMAEVYLGRIDGLSGFHKRVVVKRILPQLATVPEFVEMFLKEARLASLLEHPNLVAVFDLGAELGSYHLVMEYVEGTSLLALIQAAQERPQFLPLECVIWILAQVLEGLTYAHALPDECGHPLQLIHRDVSPENVLLSKAGSVKLADFGLAKAASHPGVTQTGAFKGKLHYLAPEMVQTTHFNSRVDLFSAGAVLFEAITNTKPFAGATANEVLDAVLHRAPPLLAALRPGVPARLQTVIDRALAKDPSRRYATARAMQQDLDHVLSEMRARPGPADLAALLAQLRPAGAAHHAGSAPAPQLDRNLAPTQAAASGSTPHRSVHDTAPPGGFLLPTTERPKTESGSATVRGMPSFFINPEVGKAGPDAARTGAARDPSSPRTDPELEPFNPQRPKGR